LKLVLLQLPVPKMNYGMKTGNAPLGAACIKQAVMHINGISMDIIPENIISYMGDHALIDLIVDLNPDVVGFTAFCWNVERSLYLASKMKEKASVITVMGGPEVTRDNKTIKNNQVDCLIFGEGESVFQKILSGDRQFDTRCFSSGSDSIFESSMSPYLDGVITADVDHSMLLETQRGCPYQCGFCYYSKARNKLCFADEKKLIQGIRWAVENGIEDLYLLDPSLNSRPGLDGLLDKITCITKNSNLSIISEIRAESITEKLASKFRQAGFTGFEIGLQTTNTEALKIMKRKSDLNQFLKGTKYLKENGIQPRIDLIYGLPGDHLTGFTDSLRFITDHDLKDDIQVFPLSVLPGTDFRLNHKTLGLIYQEKPPYTVIRSEGFTEDDMILSLDHAETQLDISIYPLPDLDLSYKNALNTDDDMCHDLYTTHMNKACISKLILMKQRDIKEIRKASSMLTSPYQIFFLNNFSNRYMCDVIHQTTTENPYTPYEIIFRFPPDKQSLKAVSDSCKLIRPHFLDNDQRYLYLNEGNRSVQYTYLSDSGIRSFEQDMLRYVFIWQKELLPTHEDLENIGDYEGILIGPDRNVTHTIRWQDKFFKQSHELPLITFAETALQKRWFKLTAPEDYYLDAFPE